MVNVSNPAKYSTFVGYKTQVRPDSAVHRLATMANIDDAILSIFTVSGSQYPLVNTLSTLPPLTTPFTFNPTCTEGTNYQQPGQPSHVQKFIPLYCQPDATMTHSPGTCISGYQMKQIVEFRTPDWTLGGLRAWGAACCREYVRYLGCRAENLEYTLVLALTNITAANTLDSDYMATASDATDCLSAIDTPITAYTVADATLPTNAAGQEIPEKPSIISSGTVIMQPMLVYWQESDLVHFDSAYASSLASKFDIGFTPTETPGPATERPRPTSVPPQSNSANTGTSPLDQIQVPSATSSPPATSSEAPSSPSNPGLSTDAKAGIGSAAVVAAILLLVAVGFVLYKRWLHNKAGLDGKAAELNEQPEFLDADLVRWRRDKGTGL